MRHIIILFFFSSISIFAQETTNTNHLLFKAEIGGGYSSWQAKTPDFSSKGSGLDFNLNLTPYYKHKNLMLGISFGYDRVQIDTLISTTKNFPYGTGFLNNHISFNKISLALGYNLIHKERVTIGAIVRIGTYKLDKSFDNKPIKINSNLLDNREFIHFLDSCFTLIHYKHTHTLIIDLRGNPGGASTFSNPMVAFFATEPFAGASPRQLRFQP